MLKNAQQQKVGGLVGFGGAAAAPGWWWLEHKQTNKTLVAPYSDSPANSKNFFDSF